MTRTFNRGARTALQAGLAGAIVTFVNLFVYPMTLEQASALGALLTIVLSVLQNSLEESDVLPTMLPDPNNETRR